MLDVYPFLMNINPLKKIPSNANINVGNFFRDHAEYNSVKFYIYCWIYTPCVHQEPTLLGLNKGTNIMDIRYGPQISWPPTN